MPIRPEFLTENYVTVQCDPSTWEDHGGTHGERAFLCYWETGVPYTGRLLMRVPFELAHHFTGAGGFSRLDR
jgi:hypothetical protein